MYPGAREVYLLFSSDIVNNLLKTTGALWSALIAAGWVIVAWSRKSCLGPADITSFECLVLFTNGGCRMSAKFHLFIFDVNQGN